MVRTFAQRFEKVETVAVFQSDVEKDAIERVVGEALSFGDAGRLECLASNGAHGEASPSRRPASSSTMSTLAGLAQTALLLVSISDGLGFFLVMDAVSMDSKKRVTCRRVSMHRIAAVSARDGPRNRETEPGPVGFGRKKGLEQLGRAIGRHAGAVILDCDDDAIGFAADARQHLSAGRRRFDGVTQDVVDGA